MKKTCSILLALLAALLALSASAETYTATAQGFGGDVTVEITVEGKDITDVKITGDGETPGVGSMAVEQMPAQIAEADTYDVDGVAGATITSTAVRDAVKAILTENGILTEEAAAFAPGTYAATFHGFTSDVTLELTLTEDAIADAKITAQAETNGIGSYALDLMPAQMVEQNTVMVDTVSGATATSNAIRQAALDILRQANADPAVFAKDPVPPTPTDVTKEADIAIIGAGAAGLAAAVEALDCGASVIVVEKMGIPGGNTVRSSGAWNVAGHPEQIEHNSTRASVEDFITYTMTGGHDINDPALVRYMVENSAAITDWMRSIGFDAKMNESYTGADVPGNARGLITGFKEKVLARGGELYLNTKAEEILTEDGKAVGLRCTSADGGTLTIRAKAVIDAAGGFGHNLEMVYRLKPEYDGFVTNNQMGATGDGIVLAQAIGAAVVDIEQIQAHPTVHQATANMLTEGCRNAGGILINQEGKRFIDECTYRDIVANAILAQEGHYAYLLITQEIVDGNANIAGYLPLGILTGPYTDMDEVAAAMNVPADTLKETVGNWNSYVANQNDPEFGSHFLWMRDQSKGPWYVAQVAPGIHHTMGGLKINTKTEVLNEQGEAIPGLFACGEVTGGVHGGNRVGGNAILDCLVFGKTAGDSAAAYVK